LARGSLSASQQSTSSEAGRLLRGTQLAPRHFEPASPPLMPPSSTFSLLLASFLPLAPADVSLVLKPPLNPAATHTLRREAPLLSDHSRGQAYTRSTISDSHQISDKDDLGSILEVSTHFPCRRSRRCFSQDRPPCLCRSAPSIHFDSRRQVQPPATKYAPSISNRSINGVHAPRAPEDVQGLVGGLARAPRGPAEVQRCTVVLHQLQGFSGTNRACALMYGADAPLTSGTWC